MMCILHLRSSVREFEDIHRIFYAIRGCQLSSPSFRFTLEYSRYAAH